MITKEEQEDSLIKEMSDLGCDIIEKLSALVEVEYDSPTTKAQIQEMLKSYWTMDNELERF